MVHHPAVGELHCAFLDVGSGPVLFGPVYDAIRALRSSDFRHSQCPWLALLSACHPSHRPTRGRIGVSRPIFQDLVTAVSSRLFLYQLLAITLTIFAFIRYVWQPLGFQPWALYLPLTLLIVLAASVLLGEEFDITRIRYSHGVMALILLVAVCWLLLTAISVGPGKVTFPRLPTNDLAYWGYAIPICIGFLVGPWLDLQQWQRAIQMHRERISIAAAYWAGSTQFFVMLLFHGCLALWALNWGAGSYLRTGIANYVYGHDLLLRLFYERFSAWTFAAYVVWLVICILSTLDSGYIALRWFLQAHAAASKSPIFSLIPESVIASPIPVFIFAGLFALFASVVKLELEYFMIFYATFFVGYSALAITRCYMNTPANVIPQVKMFCIGCLAVVIFAYGYFPAPSDPADSGFAAAAGACYLADL